MPFLRILAMVATVILITSPALIGAETMTNAQIAEQIVGKTLTSRYKGMKIRLHYNQDGTVEMKALVISAAGTWEYSDAGMCMTMLSGPKKGKTCVSFEHLEGNRFRNSEGLILTAN